MTQLLLGALVTASLAVGVFFLRFWRETGDRLFVMFACAFWMLSVGWLGVAITGGGEAHILVFVPRLIAFVLIILAVLDKNRSER